MNKFFKNHPEVVLVTLAAFFVAVIILAFIVGIRSVVVSVNKAISPAGSGASGAIYDLKGAAALDLKGLVK